MTKCERMVLPLTFWTGRKGKCGKSIFFFSSRRRHTRFDCDWSSDVCSSDLRDLGSDQYMDMAMRDLINRGEMVGPRMFVCGYGLYITNTPYKPGFHPPAGGIADGVPEVLRVVRQQIAAGADVIKMYASTGTDDDVTGFETYNYEEIKAAVDTAHQDRKSTRLNSSHSQ